MKTSEVSGNPFIAVSEAVPPRDPSHAAFNIHFEKDLTTLLPLEALPFGLGPMAWAAVGHSRSA